MTFLKGKLGVTTFGKQSKSGNFTMSFDVQKRDYNEFFLRCSQQVIIAFSRHLNFN